MCWFSLVLGVKLREPGASTSTESSRVTLCKGTGTDARLTRACKNSLMEIFYRCDLDGNGFLNRSEFNQFQVIVIPYFWSHIFDDKLLTLSFLLRWLSLLGCIIVWEWSLVYSISTRKLWGGFILPSFLLCYFESLVNFPETFEWWGMWHRGLECCTGDRGNARERGDHTQRIPRPQPHGAASE